MTIEKLKRVMWRLRSANPGKAKLTREDLRQAIMVECGTDPKTWRNNRDALHKLGWIRFHKGTKIIITDKDLLA